MMNLEDKIIAYLDGTLDETSRAELLHTLSVSPDKRKLLEEHIKLREIISLGHKPASVPLMTERKLADRIPILMQELPYLAEKSTRIAPFIPVSPTSYFTLLGRQVSNFFTSRVGQAVSLGTLALIGGMSWYMAQANGDEQVGNLTNRTPSAQVRSENVAPAPSLSSSTSATNAHRSSSSSVDVSAQGGLAPVASKVASSRSHKSSNVTSSSSNMPNSIAANASKDPATTNDQANTTDATSTNIGGNVASTDAASSQSSTDVKSVDNSAEPAKQVVNNSSSDNSEKSTTITPSVDDNKNITDPSELPPLPLPSSERNVTGGFFQADYSGSFSVRPNVKAQEYETTSGIGAPVLGAGYKFNSTWAVGVEAGKSSLSQQQQERTETPQAMPGPSGNNLSVNNRVTYATDVKDVDAYWSQATLRYSQDLTDQMQIELTGGAGVAFVDGLAPMVSLGIATAYDLNETWALTFGVSGRGAWLSGVNAPVEPTTTLGAGEAKAVVSHRPLTDELFSSSIALRAGIRLGF